MSKFDAKLIDREIDKVAKGNLALRDAIHKVAVMCAVHAFEHGDVTKATRLVVKLDKGADRQTLVRWFESGMFRWDKGADGFKLSSKKRDALTAGFGSADAYYDELMNGVKWYAFAKATNQLSSEYDVLSRAKSVLKGLVKAREQGKSVSHEGFAPALKALIADFEGKLQAVKA